MRIYRYIIACVVITLLTASSADAQIYKVRGIVYDSTRRFPMEAVSVLSSSGHGAVTNTDGFYEIEVLESDSIWFSYLNKPTMKFPVLKMVNPTAFDISLQVNVPVLHEVKIRQRNYKMDSLQNRSDYAKIFNYQKPKLTPSISNYGGVGFDLDAIVNMFRFRHNRSLASFQKRLLEEEREKFVDHRFNKNLVRRLTQLDGNALDSFMRVFRPSYTFTLVSGEYDFYQYIRFSLARFKKGLQPLDAFLSKQEDEDQ